VKVDGFVLHRLVLLVECLEDEDDCDEHGKALLREARDEPHQRAQVECDHDQQRQRQPHANPETQLKIVKVLASVRQKNSRKSCTYRRRRWDREGRGHVPPKFREKIFFGQLLCKIRAFSGKNNVTFGSFVNFSGKYHKNSGIFIIFGQESCKIRAYFSGKNVLPPKVD